MGAIAGKVDSRTPRSADPTWRWTAALPLVLGALTGCSVPVASELADVEANRVLVTLDRAGVESSKEPDPNAEGKWRVDVGRDDVARALAVMRDEQLPRREPRGLVDTLAKESLVPSEAAEQVQIMAGLAGDLERSLDSIDGVLAARVHLSVPPPVPFGGLPGGRGTAGVLIEHRGATPPISADGVQRLVAGAVAGLLPTDVAVVLIARPAAPAYGSGEFAHLGPITVTRTSVRELQAMLVGLVALLAALASLTLVLYARLSRARAALARDAPLTAAPST